MPLSPSFHGVGYLFGQYYPRINSSFMTYYKLLHSFYIHLSLCAAYLLKNLQLNEQGE